MDSVSTKRAGGAHPEWVPDSYPVVTSSTGELRATLDLHTHEIWGISADEFLKRYTGRDGLSDDPAFSALAHLADLIVGKTASA